MSDTKVGTVHRGSSFAPEDDGNIGGGPCAAAGDGLHVVAEAGTSGPRTASFGNTAVEDARPAEPNHLLQLLGRDAPDELEALRSALEPVESARGDVVYEPGEPVAYVHFPRTSVASIVKIMDDGRRIEVGTTGCEGLVGLPVFFGAESAPFQCFYQVPGSGWRIEASAFRDAVRSGPTLDRIVCRYAQYLYDQAGQSVACGQLHAVTERCARWLLMTHDRVGRMDRFPLTHEFLSIMLAVRRASVSVSAEELQRAGLIGYSRGRITVVDRDGLEAASCECYHADRRDYERLLGPRAPRAC